MDLTAVLRGILGIFVLIGIAVAFSNNRRKISWRLVGIGLAMQMVFAVFIFHGKAMGQWFAPLGWPKLGIEFLGAVVIKLLEFIAIGAKFVFNGLGAGPGQPDSMGFFFAFQVLPTIIFFASLTAVLYYLGILQFIVKGMAWFMARLLGVSGAESLSNTANVFIGQTEAPMLVRPFISTMTQSELLTIMIGGMATVAGGVMASYVQMLGQALAQAQGVSLAVAQSKFAVHLITASVMAAPASIVIAKILMPETEEPKTMGTVKVEVPRDAHNVIEAAATGASDGLSLALNVGGMLIVFIAFIALFNYILGVVGNWVGVHLSMELILGWMLKYVAIAIGVPVTDAVNFGGLFGTKIVLNEFVSYINLTELIKNGAMTEKGIRMATFALCGFANFSSIAIQLGGIAPMAPNRKKDIAALGLKSVLGGGLATLLTATLAGFLTF